MKDVPVYLFTGFLESGKTTFIEETIEDPRYDDGQITLILLCEEGEVEFDMSASYMKNIRVEVIDDINDFTLPKLAKLQKKYDPAHIMIEYNGMWPIQKLFETMPEGWILTQNFMFCDASTFLSYNANMRSLVFDKLQTCELVAFNRFKPEFDQMEFHKIVRGVTRRCDIAYELTTGETIFDDIEDPLPYDIEADVIPVSDRDFAIWYRDLAEEPQKYHGKTVMVKGRAAVDTTHMKPGNFIFGRHLMTCCVDDIEFAGYLVQCDKSVNPQNGGWYVITAEIAFKWHKLYGEKGPVLILKEITPAPAPEDAVATFY